jgi:hypothetical protein
MGLVALACSFGCGFRPTLEVAGDAVDSPVTGDWWLPAYRYRAPIVVTTSGAILAGYSIVVPADTAALVAAGHASVAGDDWRVVRRTGDQWQELDRWIDDGHGGGWNSADTRTWFQLPPALAAAATDVDTYVYYGATTSGAPPAELDRVFLFGDDFEGGLDKWTPNGRGETITIDADHVGGRGGYKFVTTGTEAAGAHRDLALPLATLMVSHDVKQAQTSASFGVARTFDCAYAQRTPAWIESSLRLATELDSGDHLQVWADAGVLDNWFSPVGTNTWHEVETVFDSVTNDVRVRADGGAWFGPYPGRYRQGTASQSLGLEGEGAQPGTFWLDNFVIRLYVEPEPTAVLGPEETLSR